MHDLNALKTNSEPIEDYLAAPSAAYGAFAKRIQEYALDPIVIKKLRAHAGNAYIFTFSAEWCKDCTWNVPVLKLLQDATGIEARVFGHLMRDTKSPYERWRIPPSPPEVKEFNVIRLPHIVVLDVQGNELGAVIENPPIEKTLEEAVLEILEAS